MFNISHDMPCFSVKGWCSNDYGYEGFPVIKCFWQSGNYWIENMIVSWGDISAQPAPTHNDKGYNQSAFLDLFALPLLDSEYHARKGTEKIAPKRNEWHEWLDNCYNDTPFPRSGSKGWGVGAGGIFREFKLWGRYLDN